MQNKCKTSKVKRIFAYICTLSLVFILASCSTKEVTSNIDEPELLQMSDFTKYGEIHNMLLAHAYENFDVNTPDITSLDEGLSHLAGFQKQFVDQMELDDESKEAIKIGLEEHKGLYITQDAHQKTFAKTRSTPDGSLRSDFLECFNNNLIDQFEYDNLIALCDATEANYLGRLSIVEFQNIVEDIMVKWEAQRYTVSSLYGHPLATSLSIAKSSLEWWSENPGAAPATRAIPIWVGADVGGALYGAVATMIAQKVLLKDINWKMVGAGAATGAISGSTGIAGKIGGWLSKLFQ